MKNKTHKLRVSTPGRICLFGEHQDYLNLPVIACAISLRISIEGNKRYDTHVAIDLPDIHNKETFSLNNPLVYHKERDYFKSSVNVLSRRGFIFSKGIDCVVKGNIPINSGTSSSSALIVSWINFLSQMSDQQKVLNPEKIAEYAYEAEVLEFAEPGGMMDQYTTAVGGIIKIDFHPNIKIERLDAKPGNFVLGDSQEPKDTQSILSRVKEQVQKVVIELKNKYPEFSLHTVREKDLKKYSDSLNDEQFVLLTGTIRNREITRKAQKLLTTHPLDHQEVGKLLNEHQAVLRDILKISTPKIDRMIDASLNAGAYGAKINGSGGGGCMFAYAPENTDTIKEAIEKVGGKTYIIQVDKGTYSESVEGF
ncbi:MAG TPA: galactokinase family protein [Balneolales bacterium]|nr:galactokinase family protein [Balneolales bacterium]